MKQKMIAFAKSEFVLCIAAACAVISMARCRTGLDREDLDRASRIALFCEAKGISLSEIMWIDGEGYLPLCRFFGRKS